MSGRRKMSHLDTALGLTAMLHGYAVFWIIQHVNERHCTKNESRDTWYLLTYIARATSLMTCLITMSRNFPSKMSHLDTASGFHAQRSTRWAKRLSSCHWQVNYMRSFGYTMAHENENEISAYYSNSRIILWQIQTIIHFFYQDTSQ